MSNLLFKRWNDFGGWLVFLIAAFVYRMTIEPTASFWDCPEFISCAEKLQVGHPPGAPFYMLVGNLFTQFASDASQVSGMVNFLNALLSAGCILFLFWSITRLVRALLVGDERKLSVMDVIIILGAGFVGALAYTFSDTFWFSAVEGDDASTFHNPSMDWDGYSVRLSVDCSFSREKVRVISQRRMPLSESLSSL